VSNITSANTHKEALGEDVVDLHFVSEASLVDHEISEIKVLLRDKYKNEAKFTGTDTERGHRTGGVGAVARAPHRLVDVKPLTAYFAELNETGRVALYCVEAAGGHTITCVIIYGWTGGAQDAKAAARTSDLIRIVFLELKAQPDGPQYIMGDLNASVPDLASLQMALEETDDDHFHAWHDIGAMADLWGSIPNEPTCRADNAKRATRRDYVIANTVGLGLIENFGWHL
jgi:hypothetical protein